MKWTDILKLQGKKVTIVGDLIVDQNVTGRASKLSPEGPYPIFKMGKRSCEPGGAGSAAIRAAELGADIQVIAPVGHEALENCNLHGWRSLILVEDWDNPVKTRFMTDWGPEIVRLDEERVPHPDTPALVAGHLAKVTESQALLISDYRKGAIGPEVMQVARRKFANIVVDGKGPWRLYSGVRIITPNDAEMMAEMGGETVTVRDIAARLLKHKIDHCLWTRGTQGAMLISCHGPATRIPPGNISAKPAVGAGDAVAAALATGLAAGFDVEEACRLAILAASYSVEDGHPITLGGLLYRTENVYEREDWQTYNIVEAWRAMGDYVVVINGVFDLLHAGHLDLVTQALEEGRQRAGGHRVRLLAAVNDDNSVMGYKNPPIQKCKERMAQLRAIKGVDLVTSFIYNSPTDILMKVKPDLYVRGADHKETDSCSQTVIDAGGESILTQRIGVTSTDLKQRIIEEWKRNEAANQTAGGNSGS